MKIAFLHMTYGLVERGSEIAVEALALALGREHKVSILHLDKNTVLPPAAPRNILEKISFRLHLDPSSQLVKSFTADMFSNLKKLKPDIIVAVNGGDQVKMLKEAFPRAKIVVFGHAGIGHDDLANLKASPDLFIALTKEAAAWAKERGSSMTKVVYIPNPIDLSQFKKAKKAKLGLPSPVVMTVGSLTAYKNIINVIEAVRLLNVSYLLVGDGEESGRISDSLSTLKNDFRWLKSIIHAELPALYKSADVFCFTPDSQEAFGMVYLEAMAAGLPIIASDDPIRRQIIGDNGYYTDPHEVESIAKQIMLAVQKGKISYHDELAQYDLKLVAGQVKKEFHALLS